MINFKFFGRKKKAPSEEAIHASFISDAVVSKIDRITQQANQIANELENNLKENHFPARLRESMIGNDEK